MQFSPSHTPYYGLCCKFTHSIHLLFSMMMLLTSPVDTTVKQTSLSLAAVTLQCLCQTLLAGWHGGHPACKNSYSNNFQKFLGCSGIFLWNRPVHELAGIKNKIESISNSSTAVVVLAVLKVRSVTVRWALSPWNCLFTTTARGWTRVLVIEHGERPVQPWLYVSHAAAAAAADLRKH